jgi:hypothetical protein
MSHCQLRHHQDKSHEKYIIKAQLSEMSKNMAELKKSTTVAPKLDKFDSMVIDKPTPTPTYDISTKMKVNSVVTI